MDTAGNGGRNAHPPVTRLELMTALLLGLAGVATSWSGYQVARWNGAMTAHYDKADAQRLESTRARTAATQVRMVDLSLFTNWLNAYATADTALAAFYQKRFRREFKPAFNAWMATRPLHNENAPNSPFALKEYLVSADDSASVHEDAALGALRDAQRANQIGDSYSLIAVLFAMVLFLAGTAGTFRSPRLHRAVVIMAAMLFLAAFLRVLRLPVL